MPIGSDCLIINEEKIYSKAPKTATYIVSYIVKIGFQLGRFSI